MAYKLKDVVERVSKASKLLLFSEPFYGLFLISLNKSYSENIPTAGVSKNGINAQLTINPEFANNLDELQIQGLVKHELLHIAFNHLIFRDSFSDKKLFNIAADLEINQYISAAMLPEGGLTFDTFPEINFPAKAGTKTYYDLLQKAKQDGSSPSLNNLLDQMTGNTMYDHETWDDFDELSDAEKKLIKNQSDHIMKQVAEAVSKKQGNIPGELKDLINKLFELAPPKFDWKGYLRRFVGNSQISYTKKLRRKYNKRYIENPGLKIKYKSRVLVGVDTSASVKISELKEFQNELYHLHKTGNEIIVAQCDTKITDISSFNPKVDWKLHGRGGTRFQPVIDEFNKGDYTALIYFTDGEASNPTNCPRNTLWVLSAESDYNEDLTGKQIKLT